VGSESVNVATAPENCVPTVALKLTGCDPEMLILQRYPLGAGMQHRIVSTFNPSFFHCALRIFACDFLAAAFSRCVSRMIRAALASRRFWSAAFSVSASSNALAASRTWQIVTSGFFFRQTQGLACQKQMTHLRDPQVSQHAFILSYFKLAQAKLALLILQTAFHWPAAESHVEQNFKRNARRRVGEKVLDRLGVESVACRDQPIRADHAGRRV
jgi:hypothetical protein